MISELEQSRGLTVRRVPLGEAGNFEPLERAAWHSEWLLFDDGWCAQIPLFSTANDEGARVLLTGNWSDQFFFVTGYLSDLFVKLA